MNRRTFLCGLTLGTLAAPLAAEAQQAGRVYRLGMLLPDAPSPAGTPHPSLDALRDGLRAFGYVEGRNLIIQYRWAEGHLDRFDSLANELVTTVRSDVIIAVTEPAAIAAKRATTTIPIVMPISGDPVAAGLATTLARPGGNATGLAMLKPEIAPKYLELLKETRPTITRVGVLFDETRASDTAALRELQVVARTLRISLHFADARVPDRYARALAAMATNRIEGLIVLPSAITFTHRHRIVDLASRQGLPVIAGLAEFADAGAMMSYGPNGPAMFRRAAAYIAKILEGASPAELPIEQPTKFDLVINLKTAKALGLTIPQMLLLRADHVIE